MHCSLNTRKSDPGKSDMEADPGEQRSCLTGLRKPEIAKAEAIGENPGTVSKKRGG